MCVSVRPDQQEEAGQEEGVRQLRADRAQDGYHRTGQKEQFKSQK